MVVESPRGRGSKWMDRVGSIFEVLFIYLSIFIRSPGDQSVCDDVVQQGMYLLLVLTDMVGWRENK